MILLNLCTAITSRIEMFVGMQVTYFLDYSMASIKILTFHIAITILLGSAVYCCPDHQDCNHTYKIQPSGPLGLAVLYRSSNTAHITGVLIMPMKRGIHPTI